MEAAQNVFAFVLAVGVSALLVFYARRQFLTLRRLRTTPEMPLDEMRRELRQSWRRLVSSGLLLLIAALLVVAQIWLEPYVRPLVDRPADQHTAEDRNAIWLYAAVWISILVLLFGVVAIAAFDLWAIRRYGKQQHRKLSDDRRAMIARQLRKLREERNGD